VQSGITQSVILLHVMLLSKPYRLRQKLRCPTLDSDELKIAIANS
jgi:hypothetical protein